MRRFAVLAAGLIFFAAACGGRPPRGAPDDGLPSVASSDSVSPSVSSQAGAGTRSSPAAGAPVTTRATASSTGGAAPGWRVHAVLDRACVRRGIDTQGLTVRNARPNGYVGYSTEYSDHSNEVTNRSYTTGYGYGKVDANGGYRATWVVPANAPAGVATLRVAYSGSDPPIVLTFNVALQTEAC